MADGNRSRGVDDAGADRRAEAEAHDETSLVYLEEYGLILWRNGSADSSRKVFKGLCTLARAWKSPELARYSRVLGAIDGGATYEAYAADLADDTHGL
jgi:hypothetical protein